MTKRKGIKNRILTLSAGGLLACVLAVILLAGAVLHTSAAPVYNDEATTIPIGTSLDLVNYAIEYEQGRHNPEDTLQLSNTTDFFYDLTDSSFPGIGTSSRPFKGTFYIPEGTTKIAANRALFAYATTDLTISCPDNGPLIFIRPADTANNPLLADNVLASEESPAPVGTWKISVVEDDLTGADTTANSFAGVIGDVGDGCKLNIDFTHDSTYVYTPEGGSATTVTAKVSGTGDVGTICGSLGAGSELTFKLTSTEPFDVTSTGGHAGGVVGVMGEGAKLIVADDNNNGADDFSSVCNVKTTSGYAGGICGEATDAEIEFEGGASAALNLSKTVDGSLGAGGVYGHYVCTEGNGTGADADVRTFELKQIKSSGLSVKGVASGGFIGYLESDKSVTVTDTNANISNETFSKSVTFSSGTNCGGIIGTYSNSDTDNTLYLHNVKVQTTPSSGTLKAGILGRITENEAYVKLDDVYVKTTNTLHAGVIGSMGNDGSFVDMTNTVKVKGSCDNGLIKYQNAGIVRLSGTTDLSEATYTNAQLIGERANGLVYALGSGSDAGWTFKRGKGKVDDIGDWGEVLRIGTNGLAESTFFTVDTDHHTVAVAAHVQNMATVSDFIKTALNIQHNAGDKGYLSFTAASASSTLLGTNLSITADIDLAGTGIQSFTRDNGSNDSYTGTFNGNSHTIYLAIGEPYGYNVTSGNTNNGIIVKHTHQGLFATTNNATFNNITVGGFDNTAIAATAQIGGLAAYATGTLTLSGVTTQQQNNVYTTPEAAITVYCGGAVGLLENAGATVSATNCRFASTMNDYRTKNLGTSAAYFGGAIAYVKSNNTTAFTFYNVKIGSTNMTVDESNRLYYKTNTYDGGINYGGLIGVFSATTGNAGSNSRRVTLTNIKIENSADIHTAVSVSGARNNGSGSFIGSAWPNVDVTIGTSEQNNGITVGEAGGSRSPTITVNNSSSGNIGVLFYKATGKMDVHSVTVNAANISSAYSGSSFGFIVNDTYNPGNPGTSASTLYLNVDMAKMSGGVPVTGFYINPAITVTGSFSVYDEIAAYSHIPDNDICDNGNAIVSLNIPDGAAVIMDGSNCNTYQNQTTYATKTNSHTRYYYNLEAIRTATLSDSDSGKKLLMWSVNRYGHSSVKNLFANGFGSTFSGNCDMEGLSYYPVDASGITINDGTIIKFYNKEIEDGEDGAGNTDSSERSTHTATQHYMMHEGIFRNYTGNLTVNGLKVRGNVSNQHGGNNSGFLICGMLGNQSTTITAKIKKISLEGAYISGRSSGQYAPLLINKIGKNVVFELSDVSAVVGTGDDKYSSSTSAKASSLIGDVGYEDASNISLTFSKIKLDARDGITDRGLSNLSAASAYGTSRSLFDCATLLNSFRFANTGMAEYNYTYAEDWGDNHAVTYGKEITDSVEYANRQKHYYDDSTHWTRPDDSACSSEYSFSTGFLPYVYTPYNSTTKYHEIKVNVKDANLETGCGQYNDPYIITDGAQLVTAAKIINGTPDDGITITLPTNITATGANALDMWCDNRNTHAVYTYSASSAKFTNGSNEYTLAVVREYLAGAYYEIENAITLPAGTEYVGLGSISEASSGANSAYAFRGVITGKTSGITITNNSQKPLITNATGCVVRNLIIAVDPSTVIEISQSSSAYKFLFDNTSCNSYGGVISKVMGGDNIIDNVSITFPNSYSLAGGKVFVPDSSAQQRLMPVGGYVGVIVNGGVIFRNMGSATRTGLTSANCAEVADSRYLYVNPIIGRVIAGYAFTESTSYVYNEANVTMKNGTKNYGICDLNKDSANKLTVTASAKDNHIITAPDAQTLFILSCIVNSGAGSAAWNNSTPQNYATTITANPWVGYRNYTCTRCALYNNIGSGASNAAGSDYDKVNQNDAYSGNKQIPYIIRNYTSSGASAVFHARSICNGNNPAVSQINLSAGTYNMPAGFRGIGSIYDNNAVFVLKFNKLVGNGAIINLQMNYVEYNHESGTTSGTNTVNKTNLLIENYKPYSGAGFGLFNTLYQNSASDTNSISDITLKGTVNYDIIKLVDDSRDVTESDPTGTKIKYSYGWHNYNNSTGYYPNISDSIEAATILNTGGVTGTAGAAVYLKNVTLDGLKVEGAKYVGGMIGYSTSVVTIYNPQTTDHKVIAGFCAGGLIGYISNNLTVTGASEAAPSVIDFDTINVKGEPSTAKIDFKDYNQMFHCAGGICGHAFPNNTSRTVTVTYVQVKDGLITATHRDKRPSDMRYKVLCGGMFGRLEKTTVNLSYSGVYNVGISANTCGGIIGQTREAISGTFDHITVDGGTNDTLDATNMAGGLIGYHFSGNLVLTVSNTVVQDYKILSTFDAEKASAGGMFGTITPNGSTKLNIIDSKITDCTVSRKATVISSNDHKLLGVGGIFGAISESSGSITGHNLLLNKVSVVNSGGNRAPGSIIGSNNGNNVKFVGVSLQGGTAKAISTVGVDQANAGIYGASGYVIMADYDGDCVGVSQNTGNSTLYNSTTNPTDYTAADPYVTVNPAGNIGTSDMILTGDGIATTVAKVLPDSATAGIPVKLIATGDIRYSIARANAVNTTPYSAGGRFLGKFSTFNTEQNTSLSDDFVVLIVDDVSAKNTTEMINAYINLLANTNRTTSDGKGGYAADQSGFYRVVISKMVYDESQGKFVKSNGANLKRNNTTKQFYMDMDSVDTAGVMFSLIDVQYYDPAASTKIAYHLYIPVLVKKMLTFDFNIATGSGTNYERAWYEDRWGDPMMENLGSPASIYFKYSYLRSVEEWQTAINNGESVLRNYDKKLSMVKSSTNHMPNDTILVLVDPSRGGKPYYARFSQVYNTSTGVLSLSGFREVLDDNTSAAFSPINLCEMLDLTASGNAFGVFVQCSAGQATVKVGNDYYRIATDSDTDLQHYDITVGGSNNVTTGFLDMEEPYYISFFTDASNSNNIYHYTISTPNSFGDPANPSRIADAAKLLSGDGIVHTILGNIFVQNNYTITTLPDDEEMSAMKNNSTLTVTMGSEINIYSGVYTEVRGYLMTGSIDVYHSFIMNLTRTDKNGVSKNIITGNPDASATYSITAPGVASASPSATFTSYGSYAEISTGYVINEYLTKNESTPDTATVTSVITLVYGTDVAIGEQFPNREDEEMRSVGTTVSGKSNIAYDPSRTSFSKSSATANDRSSHVYYSHVDDRSAKLTYNVMRDIYGGDYGHLGLNPLDSNDLTEITVPTLAVYDISNIADKAAAYDTVRVHIKLYSKVDNYDPDAMLDIPTYMQNIWHEGYDADPVSENHLDSSDATHFRLTGDGTDYTEYIYSFPKSALEANSALATSLEIPINYIIYTGSVFEGRGLTYSNYKLNLEVELTKSTAPTDILSVSMVNDFVIYTNARVLPDYVDVP